jgi:NTE family protein
VVDAVMASTAVPGMFAPVHLDGRVLVDGGLSSNLPVGVLREEGCEKVVAVRLFGSGRGETETFSGHPRVTHWAHRLTDVFERTDGLDAAVEEPNLLNTVARSADILIARLEAAKLETTSPDVLVAPDLAGIRFLDVMEDREEMFARGVKEVDAMQNELAALFDRPKAPLIQPPGQP